MSRRFFNDCDHLFLCKPFNEFCKAGDFANGPDGALLTFASDSPAYSYLQYGADGRVCHTVEKQVVSHDAICGAYYFKILPPQKFRTPRHDGTI